ncbi:hypothetical protein TEPIDINF_001730 [Tepidibacillus infernus]|uniref:YkvI family membrane protein n=1 Tax=Tepidibacillus infernus TaxID=1806172 RepID=UPI003B72D24E
MNGKQVLTIAGAYVGVVVGAGFASGQEILQFFTYFGWWGTLGSVIAGLLFAWFGYQLLRLGSDVKAASHKQAIHQISGKYIGWIMDIVVTFFLFGVAGIMLAGGGAVLNQQFGVPVTLGSIIILVLTILTLLLKMEKMISVISLFTPFLLIAVLTITLVSYLYMNKDLSVMNSFASPEKAASSNWFFGALLYVSYNLAATAPILITMGGGVSYNKKSLGLGGLLGGATLGLLVLTIHLGMMSKLDQLAGVELPTLFMANQLLPWLAPILSIVILGMIFNTAVGMLYTFTTRVVSPTSAKFKFALILSGILAYISSLAGFSKLVGTVYPVMGYLGFLLMGAVVVTWFRVKIRKETSMNVAVNQSN